MKGAFLCLSLFCLLVAVQSITKTTQNSDLITNLPGLTENINFKQYAGYITVDASSGRRLFYWFVESQNDPATDPVVLWLNGGPGCSSVAGLLTEHGPFHPNADGKTLSINPNSWNRVANVIYLESPAGVGFSYSKNPADYNVGDQRTSDDAYEFLIQFLNQKYPQYKNSEFWVTGESYGGHYVPNLAQRILQGNQEGKNPKINLAGFMAGNPWTYMPIDNVGAVFYWWTHALISDETYNGLMDTCDFTDIGPLKRDVNPAQCNNYVNLASQEMGNVNIYDIYVDVCGTSRSQLMIDQYAKAGSPIHKIMSKNQQLLQKRQHINPPYQPCIDTYTTNYLNLPAVQKALHVETTYPWQECSSIVNYNYTDVERSVLPEYLDMMENSNIRILAYSGDVDAIVPITGTRKWIASLNRTIEEPWRPWTDSNGQVGGYTVKYDRMSFVSIRNAGHMVPETQPTRAFDFFSRFLAGKPF